MIIEKAEAVIQAQEEYITLLSQNIASMGGFLFAHGYSAPEDKIKEGVRLRNKIATTIEEFNYAKSNQHGLSDSLRDQGATGQHSNDLDKRRSGVTYTKVGSSFKQDTNITV